eukprot:CAMPEP_0170201004 /NCGR_PEP_ID=MMETSP0040_2-20121228/70160_1 /TAXON_ID=641309 /ORGANISM="Lotharella oceanica, Strain CCMP622" /LENGTH=90 /DNA_ID=CAMNT_0010451201 /DNA_START=480 /DNA_END=752 /DNA_ORIENTATION=-
MHPVFFNAEHHSQHSRLLYPVFHNRWQPLQCPIFPGVATREVAIDSFEPQHRDVPPIATGEQQFEMSSPSRIVRPLVILDKDDLGPGIRK